MEQFLDSYGIQIAFIICGLIGGLAHYLKKSLKGETTAEFHEWFGAKNIEATLYTLIVFTFVMIGALAGGIVTDQTTIWAALYTGFATGFAIDSSFNSANDNFTQQIIDVKKSTGELLGGGSGQPAPAPAPSPAPTPAAPPDSQPSVTATFEIRRTGKV